MSLLGWVGVGLLALFAAGLLVSALLLTFGQSGRHRGKPL